MTVFTKPSIIANKAESSKTPLVEGTVCPEAKIAVPTPALPPPALPRRRPAPSPLRQTMRLFFYLINLALLFLLLVCMVTLLYIRLTQFHTGNRYQAYCAIPMDIKELEALKTDPNSQVVPLRWSSEPDVQIISTADDGATENFVNMLREELDIDGMIEKISVLNNGQQVNFIHDFTTNITSIVDEERCFIMELDRELVMMPDAFVLNIERGHGFDVTRVHTSLRAVLPAVREPTLPLCRSRPTYRLSRTTRIVLKRSADEPSHDYMHFSGKHIQEIEIGNLGELLEYEKKNSA
ncbi:unnamed protein product [Parnassius apollo]|uniref:Integral membrane protein 2 n=1 Tax=Parnassius apollo TaxID=110799 RepID=A0A8S3WUV7_PARAO|nr:unnamed protein product [Parnassius apollo]